MVYYSTQQYTNKLHHNMLQYRIRSEVAVEADLMDARLNGRTATVLVAISGLLHGKAG